jgi:hypothetical protein
MAQVLESILATSNIHFPHTLVPMAEIVEPVWPKEIEGLFADALRAASLPNLPSPHPDEEGCVPASTSSSPPSRPLELKFNLPWAKLMNTTFKTSQPGSNFTVAQGLFQSGSNLKVDFVVTFRLPDGIGSSIVFLMELKKPANLSLPSVRRGR